MATQLQIVNDLQRRLRETVTASVGTSEYSQLLGMFVNEAKEYIDDQWFWTVNEIAVPHALAPISRLYDFSSTVGPKAFLIRQKNDRTPLAFDVTDSDAPFQLHDIPWKELVAKRSTADVSGTLDLPTEFAIQPVDDGTGWGLELVQGPTGSRNWKTYWYNPQADLAIDGTDDSTSIILLKRLVFGYALFLAQNERGEEMGEPGQIAADSLRNALTAAIEIDVQTNKVSEELDMTNLEYLRNRQVGGLG